MNDINGTNSSNVPAGPSHQTTSTEISKADQAQVPLLPLPMKPPREPKTYMAPLPGFEWNPLRQLPRNRPCPCLSGKKFKKCHLDLLPLAVPIAAAKDYREQMAKPDLVFMTPENEERLKRFAEEGKGQTCATCGYTIVGPHDCAGVSTGNAKDEAVNESEPPTAG